ncbi:MAG: DUF3800 domain-containing protein [Elusimicrobia bacterium]|nr:DUF3800 domain-containing protein [Elusimicrobiota bacterium]MBP9127605.1 DUF3800 domain-containing protein [Elusimicrobiota bacterium]
MLFFIDESWQTTEDRRFKAGVLSAIPIDSTDFNRVSQDIYGLKRKHLGYDVAPLEIKGHKLLKRYYFRLEKKGVRSEQLDFARDLFSYWESQGLKVFASVTFSKGELDLACANENQLERPFFFLFERINVFMKENHPDDIAKLVFDDRSAGMNERISRSVSNFFHKSSAGRTFDKILKVPFFAISRENVGIQAADIIGHAIGRRFTGDREMTEFFQRIKKMQFESRDLVKIGDGRDPVHFRGIKVVKERPGVILIGEEGQF